MFNNKVENSKNKPEKGNIGRKKIPKKITPTYLHNSGLYYLERFAASKAHFKEVMLRKVKRSCMHHKDQDYESCAKMVDDLADKFEACGLLNDEVYAKAIASSMRRKGLSRRAIQVKMHHKGILSEQSQKTLEKIDLLSHETFENAEFAAALKLASKKKIGPYHVGKKEQDTKKALGIFARAGFSYDIAKQVLDLESDFTDEILMY